MGLKGLFRKGSKSPTSASKDPATDSTKASTNKPDDISQATTIPVTPDGFSNPETVQKAWKIAVDEYARDLSPEDAAVFQNATVDSLLVEFRVMEELHRSNSSALKWASKFKPFIQTLEYLNGSMKVFVQAQPLPMALIWGGVVLFLKIFNSWAAGFERILEIFERINDNLPRFKSYANLFPHANLLQGAIAKVYLDIIQFCMGGRRIFLKSNKKKPVELAGFIWKPFDSHFESILSKLKEHKVLVEDSARAAYIEEAKQEWEAAHKERVEAEESRRVIQQVQKKADIHYATSNRFYEQSTRQIQATQYHSILKWICATSTTGSFHNLRRRRTGGTCEWVITHDKFVEFNRHPETDLRRLLWISGKAGSGKSVLATRLIDHYMTPPSSGLHNKLLLYYFCNGADQRKRKSIQVIGALLSQILAQKRDLLPLVEPIYDPELAGPENIEALWDCVVKALQDDNKSNVHIIVDGVDECEDNDDLIRFLTSGITTLPHLSVILLSRPEGSIRDKLKKYSSISITNETVSEDLRTYTETTVQEQIQIEDESVKKRISESLIEQAGGMFLWVKLMVDMLADQTTFEELESCLGNLPDGLDKAYIGLLRRLSLENATRRQVASKILRWATCATRPLKLAEISTIFAVKEGFKSLDNKSRLLAPRDLLLRLCGSFLEVTSDDTVQFAHLSAKDFLLSFPETKGLDTDIAEFATKPNNIHLEIAQNCLTYLSFNEFKEAYPYEKALLKQYCDVRPFLEYASNNWTYHINCSEDTDPNLLQKVVRFVNSDCGYSWANGPAYILTPSMTSILVLQAQLSDWASSFPEDTPGRPILFNIISRMFEALYDRSVTVHGPQHRITTNSLISVGLLKYEQGKSDEAEPLLKKAMELRAAMYGPSHEKTIDCISNLGLLYYRMGRLKDSEEMARRAYEGYAANTGSDSFDAYWALNNLGNAVRHVGRTEEAEDLYRRSYEGLEKFEGMHHADTQRAYGNLGLVYTDQKRLDEASEILTNCGSIRRRIFSEEDPETLQAVEGLARVLTKQNKFEEAEQKLTYVYNVRMKILGPNHLDTLCAAQGLGLLYKRQGLIDKAMQCLQETLDSCKLYIGVSHFITIEILYTVGKLHLRKGNYDVAQELLQESYTQRKLLSSEEDKDVKKAAAKLEEARMFLLKEKDPVSTATVQSDGKKDEDGAGDERGVDIEPVLPECPKGDLPSVNLGSSKVSESKSMTLADGHVVRLEAV